MLPLLLSVILAVGPTLNHCIFSWVMPAVPSNDLDHFTLKLATAAGGPYVQLAVYTTTLTGGNSTFGPTQNLCASVSDGQKFAVVTAVDKAGNESVPSGEAPFVLDVTAPPSASSLSVQ